MAAIEGISPGKAWSDLVGHSDGRLFEIGRVLTESREIEGEFEGDHTDLVKEAFVGSEYPGVKIADVVAALIKRLRPGAPQ